MRWLWILLVAMILGGCKEHRGGGKEKEVTREIGYKGKARVNPWLAAERFSRHYARTVRSLASWKSPSFRDDILFAPASAFGNEKWVWQTEHWVNRGGHLILLVEHTDLGGDWNFSESELPLATPLVQMLDRAGIQIEKGEELSKITASKIRFEGSLYKVKAASKVGVFTSRTKAGVFASVPSGKGRISVLTDARLFRNRWIDENDNAALLASLIRSSGYQEAGNAVFLRGGSISLWGLLVNYLWPVLIGLGVWIILWLWKNFSRFGPVESEATPSPLRAYDHHLGALGDFQWRTDKAASLLDPLRTQIMERGQRMAVAAGRGEYELFSFLADLTGISRERVFRALAKTAPADSSSLIRSTADLQKMLQVLH